MRKSYERIRHMCCSVPHDDTDPSHASMKMLTNALKDLQHERWISGKHAIQDCVSAVNGHCLVLQKQPLLTHRVCAYANTQTIVDTLTM